MARSGNPEATRWTVRSRLEMLLATAGGLTAQADANAIEITSPEPSPDPGTVTNDRRVVSLQAANGMTTEIGRGEAVRVNPVFNDREAYAVLGPGRGQAAGEFRGHSGRAAVLAYRAGRRADPGSLSGRRHLHAGKRPSPAGGSFHQRRPQSGSRACHGPDEAGPAARGPDRPGPRAFQRTAQGAAGRQDHGRSGPRHAGHPP